MGNGNQYADDVVVRVSEYELPPEGSHQAVCVDVVDLGEIVGQYGPVHKVALVFQIEPDPDTGVDVARSDGERFEVVRRFSANLSERGYLRPFLEAWRGKKFTTDELRGFHLSKLVGVKLTAPAQPVAEPASNGDAHAPRQQRLAFAAR